MPRALLDATQIALLRGRLRARLARARSNDLLSISIDLGAGDDDWLGGDGDDWPGVDLSRGDGSWWASPLACGRSDHRLAIGRAIDFRSTGEARFSALQAVLGGLQAVWQHDDPQRTGVSPLAHLGFAFADESADAWPNAQLLVPAILLRSGSGRRTATFSCVAAVGEAALPGWLGELRRGAQRPLRTAAALLPQTAGPLAGQAFMARVAAALRTISDGRLEKLVLARSLRCTADGTIAIAPLLAALRDRHPYCTTYGVSRAGESFVGATPERLLVLRRGTVQVDALAGTAWQAAGAAGVASPSLHDDKNRHEQQVVVDAVRAALLPFCSALAPPQSAEVLRSGGLQHLRTTVHGGLRPGVGFFELLGSLHPTPAVGGWPAPAAGRWLQVHGERRGAWYSGGIGWVDRDGDGEAVVALRCARISGRQAELFAGAGIVAGSDPAQELAETEVKLAVIAEALRHARCRPVARRAASA